MILIKNEMGLHEQWEAGVRVATERKKKMPDSWESALKIRDRDWKYENNIANKICISTSL